MTKIKIYACYTVKIYKNNPQKIFKPGGTHLARWSWICFLHSGTDVLHRAAYLRIWQFFVSIINKIFQVILNNSLHICRIKYHFKFPSVYESGIFNSHEKMTLNNVQLYLHCSAMIEIHALLSGCVFCGWTIFPTLLHMNFLNSIESALIPIQSGSNKWCSGVYLSPIYMLTWNRTQGYLSHLVGWTKEENRHIDQSFSSDLTRCCL